MRTVRLPQRVRTAMTPPADDHRPALRVALGLAVPGTILLLAGRPDLLIYAVFGAVTGMYGRAESRRRRLEHQTQAAAILFTGVAIGVTLSSMGAPPRLLVLIAVVFAAAGSVLTDRLAIRPYGPFYGLFALGAVATVPAGRTSPASALVICGATALFSIALGAADASAGPPRPTEPARQVPTRALRYGVAVAAAGTAGVFLGVDHANWAIAAAAGPLAAVTSDGRIRRGIHRLAGTLVGLGVAAALLIPHPDEYLLALAVMVLLFPTELFMTHHHAVALGFFTPLIMLMTDLAAPAEPLALLTARGLDTVIGVAAAIAVTLLIRDG
jgi:hypothetical protein